MRTVQLELLRPEEIRQEQSHMSICYVPVGPVEWHSYHMPMGTDALYSQEVARGLAQRTGGLVAPTLFVGVEQDMSEDMRKALHVSGPSNTGMDFPANIIPSMYYRTETLAVVLSDCIRLLIHMGFRMIVIINGHGATGQVQTIQRLCTQYTNEGPALVLEPDSEGRLAGELLKDHDPGHANHLETAMMMAATDSVDLTRLPPRETPLHTEDYGIADGSQFAGKRMEDSTIMDDPRDATAEHGRAVLDAIIKEDSEWILSYYHEHVKA